MHQLQEQYITNAQGDRIAVILDITAYQKLLQEMDEFLCWKGYQEAVEETDLEIANGDFVTLNHYLATEASQLS
jgi:beta-glucosidase/6-phospho-beta-glucosidase/beta-galactosidase